MNVVLDFIDMCNFFVICCQVFLKKLIELSVWYLFFLDLVKDVGEKDFYYYEIVMWFDNGFEIIQFLCVEYEIEFDRFVYMLIVFYELFVLLIENFIFFFYFLVYQVFVCLFLCGILLLEGYNFF